MVAPIVLDRRTLDGIFGGLPEAVFATDRDHGLVYVNDAFRELFGYPEDAPVGQPLQVLHATPIARDAVIDREHPERLGRTSAWSFRRADGTSFVADTRVGPLRDAEGTVVGRLHLLRLAHGTQAAADLLQRLQRVVGDPRRGTRERLQAVLALGREHLGFERGLLVRGPVDAVDVFLHSGSDADVDRVHLGAMARVIRASQGPVGHQGLQGGGAWIGCAVAPEGDDSVLVFGGATPRRPFTADELALVRQLAELIGHLLLEQQTWQELERQAREDAVTGLLNRRAVLEGLAFQVARARHGGRALAVVLIDVDRYGSIRRTWGIEAGERVLQAMARLFDVATGPTALVGCLGQQEFLLVLPDTGLEEAASLCDELVAALRWMEVSLPDGDTVRATASMGVAALRDGEAFDELLSRADHAIFAAKAGGRAQVRKAS